MTDKSPAARSRHPGCWGPSANAIPPNSAENSPAVYSDWQAVWTALLSRNRPLGRSLPGGLYFSVL